MGKDKTPSKTHKKKTPKEKVPKGYPVLVEWDDAESVGCYWVELKDLNRDSLGQCRTAGWIVHKTKRVMTVVSSLEMIDDFVSDGVKIPVSAIQKITQLGPKRGKQK